MFEGRDECTSRDLLEKKGIKFGRKFLKRSEEMGILEGWVNFTEKAIYIKLVNLKSVTVKLLLLLNSNSI